MRFTFFILILTWFLSAPLRAQTDSTQQEPADGSDSILLTPIPIEGIISPPPKKDSIHAKPTPKLPSSPVVESLLITQPIDSLKRPEIYIQIQQFLYQTAAVSYEANDYETAIHYYELFFQYDTSHTNKDQDIQNYVIAHSFLGIPPDEDGQLKLKNEIMPLLEDQLLKNPESLDLLFAKARLSMIINHNRGLFSRKKYLKLAKKTIEQILTIDPQNKHAIILSSRWHLDLMEYPRLLLWVYGIKSAKEKDAVADLEHAKYLYPKDFEVCLELAISYTQSKQIPEAILEFRRLRLLPETSEQDKIFKQRAIPYLINLVY